MIHVAQLTPYARPTPGGISTYVDGLATYLRQHGFRVSILAGQGAGDVPDHSDLGEGAGYVAGVSRLLRHLEPDIVHCHGHRSTLAAALRYRKSWPTARVVFSVHTTLPSGRSPGMPRALKQADVLTFVSTAQMAEMRSRFRLGGDLRLLPPATTLDPPRPSRVRQWACDHGIEKAYPVLMFAGPLEYRDKVAGVVDLIRCLDTVKKDFPGVKLLIVGDGALRPLVEAAAARHPNLVTVTGYVEDARLALANATIYCHISYQEGLPLALLEAMSLGRCVIASPTGGIPEVLDGRNGRLVPPGPQPVAEAILELLRSDGEIERMGEAAIDTIRNGYTWDRRWRLLSTIYGTWAA